MPYIAQVFRETLDHGELPGTPGELNYIISTVINRYLAGPLSYGAINEVIGVLECVKFELYRRVAVPYEDRKLADNGDVYTTRG